MAQRQITAALREILNDPDRGLVLKAGFVSRVKKSVYSKNAGKVRDLKEILAKHGMA